MNLKRSIRCAAPFIGAVLLPLPAWAEEAKEGLPQFDTTLFPSQLFWLAVSFAALYCLMAFVALPGVARTQDKRHTIIKAELKAAEDANQAAKAMIEQYEGALAHARNKAQAMIAEKAAEAAKLSAEQQAEQHKELARRLTEAEAKIMATRDAALAEARMQASDLALLIVEKITATGGR